MIVDSSALVAIVHAEPDARTYSDALSAATDVGMSAASYLEAGIVVDGIGDPVASRVFDNIIAQSQISIEAFSAEQAVIARQAYRDFGKGSGHPARLNFGDCMSYALAKVTGRPLLFKGDDFCHTDVAPAIDPGQSRT